MAEQSPFEQFNFQGNPFMQSMGGGAPQGGPQAPQSPMGEEQAPDVEPATAMGQGEAAEEDQLAKGQNPDKTRFLMGAVQSLEKFITETTDREDIMIARGIISAISRLIARDQETMSSML